jgi:hypothetical protein
VSGPDPPGARLAELHLRSLEERAAAGNVEAACRLAGEACAVLRREDQRAERRFNALLHRLTPRLSW